MFRRFICIGIVISFMGNVVIPPQKAYAQGVFGLPEAGEMVNLSSAYEPVLIKGLRINLENPLKLDFIVATGNSNLTANDPQLKTESEKLIKYFYAALTLPDKDVWVNLSPYEKDRIVPQATGETEMGRDMLAQDYMLKQITASLIFPEKGLGKDFWNRIYKESYQRFGTTRIPVNTFNKVWIVADKASVYESQNTVMVVDAHLKVMLEEDYLSLQKHEEKIGHGLASQLIRSIILPALEKEVNEGKNFANLRQIFHSIILAKWYKETLKNALLNQVYSNKNKISGVDVQDKAIKEKIYQQYLEAYKKGVFNYIKDDIDQASKQVLPRKYFSGGISTAMKLHIALATQAMMSVRDWVRVGAFVLVSSFANLSSANFYVRPHFNAGQPALPGLEKFYHSGGTIWFNTTRDFDGRLLPSQIIDMMGLPPGAKIMRMRNNRSTEALEGNVLVPGRRYQIDTTEEGAQRAIKRINQAMAQGIRPHNRGVVIRLGPNSVSDMINCGKNDFPKDNGGYLPIAGIGSGFYVTSVKPKGFALEKRFLIKVETYGSTRNGIAGSWQYINSQESGKFWIDEDGKYWAEKPDISRVIMVEIWNDDGYMLARVINDTDKEIDLFGRVELEAKTKVQIRAVRLTKEEKLPRVKKKTAPPPEEAAAEESLVPDEPVLNEGADLTAATAALVESLTQEIVLSDEESPLAAEFVEESGKPGVESDEPVAFIEPEPEITAPVVPTEEVVIPLPEEPPVDTGAYLAEAGQLSISLLALWPVDSLPQETAAPTITENLIRPLDPEFLLMTRSVMNSPLWGMFLDPWSQFLISQLLPIKLETLIAPASPEPTQLFDILMPAIAAQPLLLMLPAPEPAPASVSLSEKDTTQPQYMPLTVNVTPISLVNGDTFTLNIKIHGEANPRQYKIVKKDGKVTVNGIGLKENAIDGPYVMTAKGDHELVFTMQWSGDIFKLTKGKDFSDNVSYLVEDRQQIPAEASAAPLPLPSAVKGKVILETLSVVSIGVGERIIIEDLEEKRLLEIRFNKIGQYELWNESIVKGEPLERISRSQEVRKGIQIVMEADKLIIKPLEQPIRYEIKDSAMTHEIPPTAIRVENKGTYKERNLGREGAFKFESSETEYFEGYAVSSSASGAAGLKVRIGHSRRTDIEAEITLAEGQKGSLWVDRKLNITNKKPGKKQALRLDFINRDNEIWLGALNNLGVSVLINTPRRQPVMHTSQPAPALAAVPKEDVSAAMKGGIDLDTSKFSIQKNGSGVDIKFNPAMLSRFQQGDFKGIQPIVTGITSIADIYQMFGLR